MNTNNTNDNANTNTTVLKGRLRLRLGGSKDNAAIGKRLENGNPVLHAEFFTADLSVVDDKGLRHAYEFGVDEQFAELLANGNAYNQYEVTLTKRFRKLADGRMVEDVEDNQTGTVKYHRCVLEDYTVLAEKPMPKNWHWVTCLADAKPAKDPTAETAPVAEVTAPLV